MNNDTRAAGLSGLPLQRKIPLIVLALFGFVLGTGIVVSYFEVRHAAELAAADRLLSLSRVIASLSAQPLTQRVIVTRSVAADPAIVEALRSPGRPTGPAVRTALAPLLAQRSDSGAIGLWTRTGRPVGSFTLELPEQQQSIQQEIERAEHGDSLFIGSFRSTNGRTTFWIVVPVFDRDSSVLGYLAQERILFNNATTLRSVYALMGTDIDGFLGNARDSLSVRFEGRVTSGTSNNRPFLGALTIGERPGKGEILSSTSLVQGTPFRVTVERPLSSVLSRPLGAIRRLSLFAIALVVFGGIAAWFVVHRLVAPLGEVTRAAEAIAGGDYAHRVTPHGRDEIGRLGAAFNNMVERVETASDESTRAVADLTKSVERQEFLANASRAVAGALSDDHLLTDLARLCVPRFADYATIHLVEDDGQIRRIETLHTTPRSRKPCASW
jgi:HAMP domain-containing protein